MLKMVRNKILQVQFIFSASCRPLIDLSSFQFYLLVLKFKNGIMKRKFTSADCLTFQVLGSGDHVLEDVAVKERELFISDATDEYPASAIK